MASAGKRRHLVTLTDRPDAGTPVVYSPATLYVDIEPTSPGVENEDHETHLVHGPYHSQVNTDTVLDFNGRKFWVLGVQNINERNRDMTLLCHEVKTP